MSISYQLTKADLRALWRGTFLRSLRSKATLAYISVSFGALFCFALFTRGDMPLRPLWVEAASLSFPPTFVIFCGIGFSFIQGCFRLRRAYREPWFASGAVITIDWSPRGVGFRSGNDRIEADWSEVSQTIAHRRWILVRLNEEGFLIPRRVLTAAQAEDLLACAGLRGDATGLANADKTGGIAKGGAE